MSEKRMIDEFLSRKRIAIAGVSSKPSDFSRLVFHEFASRGYEVIPVHPTMAEMDGHRCYPHLQEIAPAAEAVLIMTSPAQALGVLRDAVDSGIRSAWLYGAVGEGASSPEAIDFCQQNGIDVVTHQCPLMFLEDAGLIHRVHGWCKHLVGSYPQ